MSFLRLSVFLLIFANLVLYAWGQGYLGARDTGREPERLEAQKSPEKLRVVANGTDASIADDSTSANETSSTECRRVVGLAAADAKQWMGSAQEKLPKAKFELMPGVASFDVAIVGLKGSEGVDAKQQELKKLGVDVPTKIVKESADRVSLVFSTVATEAEAKAFLRDLNGKGVRTARVVAHPAAASALIEVTGADPAQLKDLVGASGDSLRIEECPAH